MGSYPPPGVPPTPPPGYVPPGYDPRAQRRFMRDQARAQRAAYRAQRQQMRYQRRAMRRGSVLGPLLLIALGIFFLLLQAGRIDRERFWDGYGHWWPLLLMGAGLVVLTEWALDQRHMRDPQYPPYRRSFGGGVVVLLLLLTIAGVIASRGLSFHPAQSMWGMPAFQINPDTIDEFFADKHESDQTLDVNLPAGGSLNVVNPRGDVTVSGTSDDGRVHIAVHKAIYTHSDSDADFRAQQFVPTATNDGGTLRVEMPMLLGARGDLTIRVPAGAAATVNANRGDVHVDGLQATVNVTANHGNIDLSAITGAATMHINNDGSSISAHGIGGDLTILGHAQDVTLAEIGGTVTLNGEFFGTTHLQHLRGALRLHTSRTDLQLARLDGEAEMSRDNDISADQALGPVVLDLRNGNVTLVRMAGDVTVTDRNGTIDLTAAPTTGSQIGAIRLEDRNGSIRTTLPERAGFTVQANTTNGNIDTDFALSSSGGENDRSLSGTVDGGGPQVRMTTTNGDLSLHKGDVQPLTEPSVKITLAPQRPKP